MLGDVTEADERRVEEVEYLFFFSLFDTLFLGGDVTLIVGACTWTGSTRCGKYPADGDKDELAVLIGD